MERALVLGLALADAFVDGGERVGLLGLTRARAPRGIVEHLAQALVADKAGLDRALPPAAQPARFDEVVLIGDFLTPPERIAESIGGLSAAGSRGHCSWWSIPSRRPSPFTGQAVLHDLEGGPSSPSAMRLLGRALPGADHRPPGAVAGIVRGAGWTLTLHRTDRPASEAALRLATLVIARGG